MFSGAAQELRFKAEINKHMLIGFSILELRIMTSGHVYEAFVLRILQLDGIFTLIKSLKIVLVTSEVSLTSKCSSLGRIPLLVLVVHDFHILSDFFWDQTVHSTKW
jgi:hypothetical protein